MSELKQEQILLNDNINDIFERKIEVGAVIQFNLLQRIIEEFIKRQKLLNDKVNNIEIKINNISERPLSSKITDDNLMKYFNESNKNLDEEKETEKEKEISIKEKELSIKEKDLSIKSKEINIKEIETSKENNIIKPEVENEIKEDKKEKKDKKKEIYDKIELNKDDDNNRSEVNNNKYRILSGRIDKFEKILKELTKKVLSLGDNNKKEENNKPDDDLLEKQNEKIEKIENDIYKINQTLKDVNFLGYFQNDGNNNDKEENTSKNNEIIKLFSKKLELIEHKTRQCDEDIFKLKKEMTGVNNILTANKNNYNDLSKESNKNFIEIKDMINKEINNLKNLIDEKNKKTKNDLKEDFDNDNKKIKSMIEELNTNINNNPNNNDNSNNNLLVSNFNEKLKNMNNDLKALINKSSSDTEKYLKSIINNLGIDNIKKDLSNIHQDLAEKIIRTDLDYIDLKIKEIENRIITETLKLESLEKDVIACNDSCTKSVKMIEYLSGQVVQKPSAEIDQENKDEMLKNLLTVNEKEIKSFVNKNEFNHEIKNIYKKIEQILEVEGENYKFTQHIEKQLKYFVTQKDLKTMEQCIMNLIDDLKNNFSKKYMEKVEILKNFKFMEIQIKNIYDLNPGMIKEGDNWLLAKKPMNSYLCASCESFIGDLKNNKNDYLAWNKIPPHDNNKRYRMGNGFSRMLELVNTDLMKNAERINDNLVIKMDDKKINYDIKTPLPRLGSQINLKKWNKPSNTFYVMNNDSNIEKRLNNSADGLDNNNSSNNNIYQENENDSSNYNNIGKNNSNIGGLPMGSKSRNNISDKDSPKILKIIKKTKNDN